MKLLSIALLILIGSFGQVTKGLSANDIVGNWKVISQRTIGQFNGDPASLKNSSFFGLEVWSQSVGKRFEFTPEGQVNTNIAGFELPDFIEMKYDFTDGGSILTFSISNLNLANSELEYFEVQVDSLSQRFMTWTLDDVTELTLEKK